MKRQWVAALVTLCAGRLAGQAWPRLGLAVTAGYGFPGSLWTAPQPYARGGGVVDTLVLSQGLGGGIVLAAAVEHALSRSFTVGFQLRYLAIPRHTSCTTISTDTLPPLDCSAADSTRPNPGYNAAAYVSYRPRPEAGWAPLARAAVGYLALEHNTVAIPAPGVVNLWIVRDDSPGTKSLTFDLAAGVEHRLGANRTLFFEVEDFVFWTSAVTGSIDPAGNPTATDTQLVNRLIASVGMRLDLLTEAREPQ